jgi:hypothetical protein
MGANLELNGNVASMYVPLHAQEYSVSVMDRDIAIRMAYIHLGFGPYCRRARARGRGAGRKRGTIIYAMFYCFSTLHQL